MDEMSLADWSKMVEEIIGKMREYNPQHLTIEELAQYYEALTGLIRTTAAMQREIRSNNAPPEPIKRGE